MIILVTYDLKMPGRDYGSLFDAIKTLGPWAHPAESVWITDTTRSPDKIRDDLKQEMDSNDLLFVIQLRLNWASYNLDAAVVEWLQIPSLSW